MVRSDSSERRKRRIRRSVYRGIELILLHTQTPTLVRKIGRQGWGILHGCMNFKVGLR